MIRVMVVDDEPLARSGVVARLARHDDLQVIGEYADAHAALSAIRSSPPDLLLLDIQMPEVDGFDMLDQLAGPQRPMVIFLTAHADYAIRAFDVRAVDYLLKPIEDERLDEALKRVREVHGLRLRNSPEEPVAIRAPARESFRTFFTVRVGRRTKVVQVAEVDWIEADGDYAALHTAEGLFLLREPLTALSDQLDPSQFARVHRSTIVRLDKVDEFQPLTNRDALLRLRDGTPIRISRTYTEEFFSRLARARQRD